MCLNMACFQCFCCCKSSKGSQLTRRGEKKSWFCCYKSGSKEEGKERKKGKCWGFGCFCCAKSSSKGDSPGRKGCRCFLGKDLSKVNPESGKEAKRRGCFSCFGSSKDSKGRTLCCFNCCKDKSSAEDSAKSSHEGTRCFGCCNGNSLKEDSTEKGERGAHCSLDYCKPKSSKKTIGRNWCCFSCCNGRSSKEDSTKKGTRGTRFCLGWCKPKSSMDDSLKKANGGNCCVRGYNSKSSKEDSTKEGKRGTCFCLCCNSKSSKEEVEEDSSKKACCDCYNGKSSKKVSTKKEKGETCFCFGCCNPKSSMEHLSKKACGKNYCCFHCCKDNSLKEDSTKKEKGGTLCCLGCCNPKSSKEDLSKKAIGRNCCCFGCCNGKSSEEDALNKHSEGNLCCHRVCKTSKEDSPEKSRRGFWCFCSCCCCKNSKKDSSKKRRCCIFFCCGKTSKQPGHMEARCSNMKPESLGKKRSRVMCCSGVCCTNPAGERRPMPKARCYFNSFCCIQSSKKRKTVSSICLQSKEQQDGGKHLAILEQKMSLKNDNDGKHGAQEEDTLLLGNVNTASQVFTYEEIAAATTNFSINCLLHSDGFGRVYRGLLSETNEAVVVKKLEMKGNQGAEEFLAEVTMLSLLHHPNLVKLLGCCVERDERILVYEFMSFGSLQEHLHDVAPNSKPLDWFTRMKVAAGAAKGLEHLHEMANPPVIYRDMKASSLLLDEHYNPKLSDFGLAKLGPVREKAHVSAKVMGNYGYCAPEYTLAGKLSKSSDVYSYGVLLLELITGRKAVDNTRPKDEQLLTQWATPLLRNKRRFANLVDPTLSGSIPMKGLYQAIAIADMCLHHEASTRPLIRDVAAAVEHLAKPDPACCAAEHLNKQPFLEQSPPPNHGRMRTDNMSFEEETFQSLSSDAESSCNLRDEDE